MNIYNHSLQKSRKPNLRKWICPVTGKYINTRGVPAYIRNRFGIEYKTEYLGNPEKLNADYENVIEQELYIKTKALFDEMALSGELKYDYVDVFFRLFQSIRRALVENDLDTLIYLNSTFKQLLGLEENYHEYDDSVDNSNQSTLF